LKCAFEPVPSGCAPARPTNASSAVKTVKRVYSSFSEPALGDLLRRRKIDSLLITGAKTDVCVLATVLDAVDLGYRWRCLPMRYAASQIRRHSRRTAQSLSPPL
jgi:nicotinamidase-related amidase